MFPNTTPVPNALFDMHLKDLKVAELKVLLVVTRQTLGWCDRSTLRGRKEKDWISNSQLLTKTGCSRRAVSYATEVLVHKGLIGVLDATGRSLITPAQRKGKTRLYYRLAPTLLTPVDYKGITDANTSNNAGTNTSAAQDLRKNVTELAQRLRITKPTLPN